MRILEVFREPFAFGGQESYIMNMYRNMDHDQIVMDFLTPFEAENQAYMREIESFGGTVYHYDHPFGENNNRVFKESLEDFLSRNAKKYDAIHFQSGSSYALKEGPKIAKKYGIPYRIVHSHSCGFDNWKHQLVLKVTAPAFRKYPTHFAACSLLAGNWKFPKDIVDEKLIIFKNAVDLEKLHFNQDVRDEVRKEFNAEDQLVFGHVGRFSIQKNHNYLIELFEKIHARYPQSVLWLIGIGELQDEIRNKVNESGLSDSVRFFNLRDDVNRLYQGMDVFLLPSFFEGLPMVGIEAQASGLPVLCSDHIARELPVEDLAWYLPLNQDDAWLDTIEKAKKLTRRNTTPEFIDSGYEVKEAARILQDFYLGLQG